MRSFLSVLILTAGLAISVNAQTWKIDQAHTNAQFSVRHMGISTVRGSFTKVSGTVQYDPADASKTKVDATIETASVDTRVEMRDNDLKGPNFFDAAKYPTITFTSKRVTAGSTGKLLVTGDLNMHGVSKEVVLEVDTPGTPVKDPKGNLHIGSSATTKINRHDFGVNGASAMVGDEVTITIDMELVQAAPTT